MKNWLLIGIILIFSVLLHLNCENTNIEPPEFSEKEIARLLTGGDTAKIWQRIRRIENNQQVNLSGCDASYHLLFGFESSAKTDTLFLSFIDDTEICNDSTILFQGVWDVREDFQKDSLIWRNEQDTLYYIINDITSLFLELSFRENGKSVKETYEAVND